MLRIDPGTGDYVLTGGHFERDDGLSTPVFLLLFTERGSYLDDPELGSRLHLLLREKSATAAAKKVPSMVKEALQPLVDDRRVSAVDVDTEVQGSRLAARIVVTDTGNRPYVFEYFQEVGG